MVLPPFTLGDSQQPVPVLQPVQPGWVRCMRCDWSECPGGSETVLPRCIAVELSRCQLDGFGFLHRRLGPEDPSDSFPKSVNKIYDICN